MELRHLRYFVAVVEQKGFREASRHLHVVQPAITKTISNLEEELGVKLFTRNGRSIQLTPQGDVFYRETLRTLEQSDRAAEAAQRAGRGETGILTLGCCSLATCGFLPAIVKEYKRLFPGVKLVFREMTPPQQEKAFEQGRIDLGITRPPFTNRLSDALSSRTIIREPLIVALPEAHDHAGSRIKLEALSCERLIVHHREGAPSVYDAILSLFHERGLVAKIEYESDNMQTVLMLVAAEQGVSILPMVCASNSKVEGVRFCRLQPDDYRAELVVAWPKRSESPARDAFLDLIGNRRKEIDLQTKRILECVSMK